MLLKRMRKGNGVELHWRSLLRLHFSRVFIDWVIQMKLCLMKFILGNSLLTYIIQGDGTDGSIYNDFIFSMYILRWLKFCSLSLDGLLVMMDTFCLIILATRTLTIKCRMLDCAVFLHYWGL